MILSSMSSVMENLGLPHSIYTAAYLNISVVADFLSRTKAYLFLVEYNVEKQGRLANSSQDQPVDSIPRTI